MIQVNRIYLIFNRLVTKKFLVDTSDMTKKNRKYLSKNNKKNAFYDKYTESKHFKRENT